MKFLFAALVVASVVALPKSSPAATDYFPPPDSQGGWRTLKDPAEVLAVAGINSDHLDDAFAYAAESSQHGGLLVARHGWLVYERYYGRGNREAAPAMASCGKTLVSIGCGIMLHEKPDLFPNGLDQKVFTEKYLPEAFPLDDKSKAAIALGDLLSMAAGFHGEGGNPGFVNFEPSVKLEPYQPAGLGQDLDALRTPMWTKPGKGYSYSSASAHVASLVLRHAVGMELQEYIDERVAKPLGWGAWGYAGPGPHTTGGGDCAIRSTDVLRFAYLLLHHGEWNGQQIVPANYVADCSRPTPFQHHAPFSLMFEVNADKHVPGAPTDAYFKSGGGGFGICVVPSLDLVIYKMAGSDHQYDPAFTHQPENYPYDGSRDDWKPPVGSQFCDGSIGTDTGVRRVLEMVVAAVVK